MANKDLATKILADITVASAEVVDVQGAESLTYLLETIDTTNVALEHGDDDALADAADVPEDFIIVGDATGALSGNDVVYDGVDTAVIGYVGGKRYVRATITNPATNAAICTVKGDLLKSPGV